MRLFVEDLRKVAEVLAGAAPGQEKGATA
jgi:hypothetical protein